MKHRRIPTWLLERVAVGEVPPEYADEVRDILAADPDERARLAELERSNAEILAELPPDQVAAEVTRRASAQAAHPSAAPVPVRNGRTRLWSGRRLFALSSGLAAAAGAVLVTVAVGRQAGWIDATPTPGSSGDEIATSPGDIGSHDRDSLPDVTRVKGPPRLLLHRKRSDGKTELLDAKNDAARAGDRIQISYMRGDAAHGAVHGVILSIDGAGAVTLHFPPLPGGSTLLKRPNQGDSAASLSHSYELDDAPDYERFLFVTSPTPIDVGAVLVSAEKLARDRAAAARDSLALPPTLAQLWYTLRKETAP